MGFMVIIDQGNEAFVQETSCRTRRQFLGKSRGKYDLVLVIGPMLASSAGRVKVAMEGARVATDVVVIMDVSRGLSFLFPARASSSIELESGRIASAFPSDRFSISRVLSQGEAQVLKQIWEKNPALVMAGS